jgi:hypothetical protein
VESAAARLAAIERQPVREETGVAAPHALNPDARGAERRRGGLYAHAAHFVQHHDDVPGRHEHLLFNLFAVQRLDTHRLIFESSVGACAGNNCHFFFKCDLRLELDTDKALLSCGHCNQDGDRDETLSHNCDPRRTDRHPQYRNPEGVGQLRHPTHDHLRRYDDLGSDPYLDPEPAQVLGRSAHRSRYQQGDDWKTIQHASRFDRGESRATGVRPVQPVPLVLRGGDVGWLSSL